MIRSLDKYFLPVLMIIMLWHLLIQATSVLAVESEWRKYPAGSSEALIVESDYVKYHRDNLELIYELADDLYKHHRFLEVLHVYKSALVYYPRHSALKRKFMLAESDWQESKSSRNTKKERNAEYGSKENSQIISSKIAQSMDQIKCRRLYSEEGTNACLRLKELNKTKPREKTDTIVSTLSNEQLVIIEPIKPLPEKSNLRLNSEQPPHQKIDVDLGGFHALVIGNNNYKHFPTLETARNDAVAIADILENKYNFNTTILNNANRYDIFRELSRLRKSLSDNDNLLIYYAGHGYLDEDTQRGYWLPTDAEKDNYANWLSTNDITDMLNGMTAKHVMVVADSCYSGTLSRGIVIPNQIGPGHSQGQGLDQAQIEWIQRIAKKRSRTVMTSGGLEPVLDSGNGQHSIFAEAFLNSLNENLSIIDASSMFDSIRRAVILNADQTPEYADIRKAGHKGGDFIFSRTN